TAFAPRVGSGGAGRRRTLQSRYRTTLVGQPADGGQSHYAHPHQARLLFACANRSVGGRAPTYDQLTRVRPKRLALAPCRRGFTTPSTAANVINARLAAP